MKKQAKGMVYLSLLSQVFLIVGLILVPKALVDNARERELYRTGRVVEARIAEEQRYTERTLTRVFLDFDGFSELFAVEDEPFVVGDRRTRYRYQLYADGVTFTLRNRPGTERLQTGTDLTIIYDLENVSEFRLYTGAPHLKTGLLLSGLGSLIVGAISLILLLKFKLWR